ncbi:TPA: Blp family class II bacteriocin [Streptococcus suis]|uniref:Blp family class II bacteriocin n=1 Tax=Streptococcus suis TaxID=1307 RepID=UPI002A8B30F9|nr:Blp family class II bacteriocin [Streptococcus suis]HEM5070915.1 Blp family class II bacteriocin [Streptococcus suis]HEM5205334.1 Blp family class II bacteriocin [Streptococcus suis]HEM5215751.1 Blp family class II bacteriocin [Streptococcus suis]
MENQKFNTLTEQELVELNGGSLTLTIGTVVLVGWKAAAAYGAAATVGTALVGAGIYNGYRGR